MTEWRIKEISDLTQTSVRMLRHYDKIGLLKPSYRSANGYRCYTAEDLAELQQIIALKYFGFSLSTIKTILQKHPNIYAHLQAQQQVLKEQSVHLQQVTDALGDILKRLSPSETPDGKDSITLISRYHMTKDLRNTLKKTWAGQTLTESQFEEYLSIYEQFPQEFAARDKIIEEINNNELGDPEGPDGERVASFMYDLAQKMRKSFTKQLKLNSSIIASIQSGKLSQLETTPEGTQWLGLASLYYWLKRWDEIYDHILENLKADPKGKVGEKIAAEWTGLLDLYFSMGSRALITGVIVWQDLAKQEHELKELKNMPTPQDLVKRLHLKLFFNPEAVSWISQALETHAD
ncbi:MAG: MerR family transcriptional regulator [Tatlockia sp.]|nr:MerR family transcriptional regulator [Tatlockia sp.]